MNASQARLDILQLAAYAKQAPRAPSLDTSAQFVIRHHITRFTALPGIYAAGGLTIGFVPSSLTRYRAGHIWLTRSNPIDKGSYSPRDVVIKLRFPMSDIINDRLVCWDSYIKHQPKEFRQAWDFADAADVWFFRGPVSVAAIVEIRGYDGALIVPSDFANLPVVKPKSLDIHPDCEYTLYGRLLTRDELAEMVDIEDDPDPECDPLAPFMNYSANLERLASQHAWHRFGTR
jgi:hypothetical protein